MNAISSSINKGAVNVAPKAGTSRRSKPTRQRSSSKTALALSFESPPAQADRLPDDRELHHGSTPASIQSIPARTIPVVGLSSSRRKDSTSQLTTTEAVPHEELFQHNSDHSSTFIPEAESIVPGLANVGLQLSAQRRSVGEPRLRKTSYLSTRVSQNPNTGSAPRIQASNSELSREAIDATTRGVSHAIQIKRPTDDQIEELTNERLRQLDTTTVRSSEAPLAAQSVQPRPSKKARQRSSLRARDREPTPDAAELEVIDTADVRMLDLCKDLHKGKKSVKYLRFKRLAVEKKRKRLQECSGIRTNDTNDPAVLGEHLNVRDLDEAMGQKVEVELMQNRPDEAEGGSDDNDDNEEANQDNAPRTTSGAPQVRIVDGKIVLDVGSLQVDRSARDASGSGAVEYVEEDPLEKFVNSRSYSRHKITPRWDPISTELFYTGLSQWGTDFDMISRMFPNRTRKQIKNKFTTEERKNPIVVTRALIKQAPVDMEEYSRISEIQFRSVAELEMDLAELKAKFASEREEAVKEAQERKTEALEGLVIQPLTQDTKRKSRRRAMDSGIEVVGNIDEVEAEEREARARAAMSSDDENEG